jgi:hypothetical protein
VSGCSRSRRQLKPLTVGAQMRFYMPPNIGESEGKTGGERSCVCVCVCVCVQRQRETETETETQTQTQTQTRTETEKVAC